MTPPKPSKPDHTEQHGDEVLLTPDDEAALDSAWESITDAEIRASIRWLDKQEAPPHKAEEM